jgi:PAS domain S-box-containing protein
MPEDVGAGADLDASARQDELAAALADAQLQLDEERLAHARTGATLGALFASMTDLVVVADPRGVVTQASAAAADLLGVTPDELEGRQVQDVLPTDLDVSLWALRTAHGGRLQVELDLRAADGHRRAVSLSASVVEEPVSGKVTGAVYVARDLSRTQQLVAELAAAEHRATLLADVSGLLSAAASPDRALQAVADRLAGEAAVAVALLLLDGPSVGTVVASDDALEAALAGLVGRAPEPPTLLAAAIDGATPVRTRHAAGGLLLGVPLPSSLAGGATVVPMASSGQPIGALVLVAGHGDLPVATADVAEQVAGRIAPAIAAAQLRETVAAMERLHHDRQVREELLSALSHDMKTPLTIIGMLSEQLAARDVDDDARSEMLVVLRRQARHLRRLVLQFLDFVRSQAGHDLGLRLAPVDPLAVVHTVVGTLESSGRVEVHVDGAIPLVQADDDRLEQIVANLVDNALKYSPSASTVRLEVTTTRDVVRLAVVDHGPGIAPERLTQLFAPFERGPATDAAEGTGIGLYLTRRMVDAHGGHLHVASRPGEGSRFEVTLPVAGEVGP